MVKTAAHCGMAPMLFDTGMFQLSGMLRKSDAENSELVVYIEGDGNILDKNNRLSNTPVLYAAQSFQLALSDPAPQLLYLARIGQFNRLNTAKHYKKYWGESRFSIEAVLAANQAINQAKSITGAKKIHLIGFSGGGGLAILLAEQREDASSLVTIAGLLDTQWWEAEYLPSISKADTTYTGAFASSVNPAEQAFRIEALPQIHFSGSKDTNIPPEMVNQFKKSTSFKNFRHVILQYTHNEGWTEHWPQLLELYVLPLREEGHLN